MKQSRDEGAREGGRGGRYREGGEGEGDIGREGGEEAQTSALAAHINWSESPEVTLPVLADSRDQATPW